MTFPLLVIATLAVAVAAWLFARSTGRYAIAAIVGSAAVLALHSIAYFDRYTSDDAYITYRYARNLADGHGPVWNSGERVEGYSNFLWMALLAVAGRLGGDIPVAGEWLGFILAVACGGGAYMLARELMPGEAGRTAGLLAAILLAASGSWALWATAGLEGPLLALLILAGVLFHIRETRTASPASIPWSAVPLALAALTRPDGIIFFAVTAVFKLQYAMTRGDSGAAAAPARAEWRRMLLWAAMFAAIFLPYFAWRFAYYGHPLPNTYYAKVGGGLDQYDRGLRYLMSFAQEYAAWTLLLVPVAAIFTSIRRRALVYVASLVVVWLAYTAYVGGDSLLRWRFVTPVLPLMYAVVTASAVALGQMLWQHRSAGLSRPLAYATAAVIALAAIAFTLHPSAAGIGGGTTVRAEREAVRDHAKVGRWLREAMPPDTTVAVIAAGALPYESRLAAIDMLGLNDEHIAHRDLDLGTFAAGHEKYDAAYVLDRQPDIIFLNELLTPSPLRRADYEAAAAVPLIPALSDMLRNPRLWAEYEMRSFELAEGAWINLFVRRDANEVRRRTVASPP